MPGMINARGERRESRVTAPQAPPLTVIMVGFTLCVPEDAPRRPSLAAT
jgi:hypothetical protein